MRLLHTQTFTFTEFYDENVPRYAILSHRWGPEEVSYQAFLNNQKRDTEGYKKILDFCEFARNHGYDWVWIDTCCIDKTSSAELSESVNSMYHWYWEATLCVAYLADLPDVYDWQRDWKRFARSSISTTTGRLAKQAVESLSSCAWFKRGWTLQELLAPKHVTFCNSDWNIIGTKSSIAEDLSDITGIDLDVLLDRRRIRHKSVAKRMSWAAGRETTRTEDAAYCLLGLFDVNMPLVYGERHKAFIRLQLEIIKMSDDESIFAWAQDRPHSGLLATSPHAFKDSWDVVRFTTDAAVHQPYQMTNRGLAIYLRSGLSDNRPCSICKRTRQGKQESSYDTDDDEHVSTISRIFSFMSTYHDDAAKTQFLLSYPESCRTVQLACGSTGKRRRSLSAPTDAAQKNAKQNPVIIKLHKSGIWQRVDCGRLIFKYTGPGDQVEKGRGSNKHDTALLDTKSLEHQLYYIPQL